MVHFKSLTVELLSQYKNNTFIETGSQHGYGIEVAIACGFEKIYSIDIDPQCHHECSNKFKKEIDKGQVELFIGDSAIMLQQILKKVYSPVTFWLDAHASAGIIGIATCPVLYELDQIKEHHIKTHTILVDDRRMFGLYWGVGTSEDDVRNKILNINPEYQMYLADGCEPNDIIVAYV